MCGWFDIKDGNLKETIKNTSLLFARNNPKEGKRRKRGKCTCEEEEKEEEEREKR